MYIHVLVFMMVFLLKDLLKTKVKLGKSLTIAGKDFYLIVCFLLFTFVQGFRSTSVGTDTGTYSRIYANIAQIDLLTSFKTSAVSTAPLYILLCKIASFLSDQPIMMIFFTSFFINVGLFYFIKRVSMDVVLSTFCWIGLAFFYSSMNIHRQAMAVVLLLNASVYLAENIKSKKGWLLFFASTLLHITAWAGTIVIAGIIFANKSTKDIRQLFLFFAGISVAACALFFSALQIVLRFFPRYTMYFEDNVATSIFESNGAGRIVILYIFLFLVVILGLLQKTDINNTQTDFAYKITPTVTLGVILGIVYADNTLMNRIVQYYTPFFIVYIPFVLARYKKETKLLLTIAVIFVLTVYSMWYVIEDKSSVRDFCFYWYAQ